jgi:hypothetical protein
MLYSLVIKSRRMRWTEHFARVGQWKGAHRLLVAKPEKNNPLRRLRHRWDTNTKKDIQQNGRAWTGFIWFKIETIGRPL